MKKTIRILAVIIAMTCIFLQGLRLHKRKRWLLKNRVQ